MHIIKILMIKNFKISLNGNTLSVNGNHVDEDFNHKQTLKRSFSRKYAIPEDIYLKSIKSSVTDSGYLIIKVFYFFKLILKKKTKIKITKKFFFEGFAKKLERNRNFCTN